LVPSFVVVLRRGFIAASGPLKTRFRQGTAAPDSPADYQEHGRGVGARPFEMPIPMAVDIGHSADSVAGGKFAPELPIRGGADRRLHESDR